MGLRDRLRRLTEASRQEIAEIPQMDGSVKRFPKSALQDAFLTNVERMGAGEDAPPEHPLTIAARNSSDAVWRNSFYAAYSSTEPIEDLSE